MKCSRLFFSGHFFGVFFRQVSENLGKSPSHPKILTCSYAQASEDAKFIESEIQLLLAADIIEPARSPWRAQVLVVHQGPKKRLVMIIQRL